MTKKGVRPGFSLMDWNRKRIDCKMTGTVSLDELRRHATSNDAWTVYEGQVYDITPYLDYHPGGVQVLEGSFGGDCTQAFKQAHRWVNGHALLGKCRVGAVEGWQAASGADAGAVGGGAALLHSLVAVPHHPSRGA